MPQTFRALLIDPYTRTITSVPYDGGDPKALVGAERLDFFKIGEFGLSFDQACIDACDLTHGETVCAFRFDDRDEPIGGKCLVRGVRLHYGEPCDAMMSMALLRERVQWLGRIVPRIEWVSDGDGTGSRTVISWKSAL